jgi:multimeric flavodoxin WrbA
MACDRGWGSCRDGDCILVDDFQALRMKIKKADALVFSTPVYCHDLSESAKRFLDRLRRCEILSDRNTCKGTKAIGIAAAGGRGNGAIRTLYNLEDYFNRLGLEIFELVSVTRYTKQHKLPMLTEAGRNLALLIQE